MAKLIKLANLEQFRKDAEEDSNNKFCVVHPVTIPGAKTIFPRADSMFNTDNEEELRELINRPRKVCIWEKDLYKSLLDQESVGKDAIDIYIMKLEDFVRDYAKAYLSPIDKDNETHILSILEGMSTDADKETYLRTVFLTYDIFSCKAIANVITKGVKDFGDEYPIQTIFVELAEN